MVRVRPARVDDAAALVAVHEQASAEAFEELVGERFDIVFPFNSRLDEWTSRLAAGSAVEGVLVAEASGIVGLAVWRVDPEGSGELEDLHVVPAAWGTGAARALLDAALAAIRVAGGSALYLWVGEANGRARRFYEREGWSHDGTKRPSSLGPIELRYRLTGGSHDPPT
jgi:GNAT superfamily N-acetyltransferase